MKNHLMRKVIGFVLICGLLVGELFSQNELSYNHRNFPIIFTLQFHSLSLPFKDIKSNFANIGFGIGTEVRFNKKANILQQFQLIWYTNRQVGDGVSFFTQTTWRPNIYRQFYTEVKAGLGYVIAKRPVSAYQWSDQHWVNKGKKGKGILMVPVGLSLGIDQPIFETPLSPFISYQFLILSDYNDDIPLVPETLIQIGSRWHFQ